jgi:hypothetical protein
MTRGAIGKFCGTLLSPVLLLGLPGVALAAPDGTEPTRMEKILFILLAAGVTVLLYILYRIMYNLFLEWRWPIGFGMFNAFGLLVLAILSVWLFVYLHLWEQIWWLTAWIAMGALWGVMAVILVIGLVRYTLGGR